MQMRPAMVLDRPPASDSSPTGGNGLLYRLQVPQLIGRTYEKVARRAKEMEQRWGVRANPVKADMSDWDQIHGPYARPTKCSAAWTS